MVYAKRLLKPHINACVSLAQQTSPLHFATIMTLHTRTNVNTTIMSVRRKKSLVSSIMADANVSPYSYM